MFLVICHCVDELMMMSMFVEATITQRLGFEPTNLAVYDHIFPSFTIPAIYTVQQKNSLHCSCNLHVKPSVPLPSPTFLIFSGGMPRASYGDRHCISIIHSKTHEALDFTSRIIDFFVIREGEDHRGKREKLMFIVSGSGDPITNTGDTDHCLSHLVMTYIYNVFFVTIYRFQGLQTIVKYGVYCFVFLICSF